MIRLLRRVGTLCIAMSGCTANSPSARVEPCAAPPPPATQPPAPVCPSPPAPASEPAKDADLPADAPDCSFVDATQNVLGDVSLALQGLDLKPGKALPPGPLPHELFRVPIRWPAAKGGMFAVGFETPYNGAGFAVVSRGCIVNLWNYEFGGNGVHLTLGAAFEVHSTILLPVLAEGFAKGWYPEQGDPVPSSFIPRWLVFAISDRRADVLADSEAEGEFHGQQLSLEQAALGKVTLVVRGEKRAQRLSFDEKNRRFVPKR